MWGLRACKIKNSAAAGSWRREDAPAPPLVEQGHTAVLRIEVSERDGSSPGSRCPCGTDASYRYLLCSTAAAGEQELCEDSSRGVGGQGTHLEASVGSQEQARAGLETACDAASLGGGVTCGDSAGGGAGKGKGIVGSSRGQKAKGNGHLGNQMSGGPTTGLLGKGGSNRRAVDTLQWRLNIIVLRQQQWNWDRGWQAVPGPGGGSQTTGTGGGPGARDCLLAYSGPRTQCEAGGSRTSPAGVDPTCRIRGAGLGRDWESFWETNGLGGQQYKTGPCWYS